MFKRLLLVFLLTVLSGLLALPSRATTINEWRLQRVAASAIGESQAIQIALREVAGKALSAQLGEENGRKIYRVKILKPDGRVRTVIVDAENGRIL